MINRWNRYVVAALFAFAFVTAGCAAKDVQVSQRGPIRGEATIEGDKSTTQSEESKKKATESMGSSASGTASGSGSASGSASSGRSSEKAE
jgi:hypothetical protein